MSSFRYEDDSYGDDFFEPLDLTPNEEEIDELVELLTTEEVEIYDDGFVDKWEDEGGSRLRDPDEEYPEDEARAF